MQRVGIFCCAILVTSSAFGQFPSPQPNEKHKHFQKEVGTWDCEMSIFSQAGATKYKAVEVNTSICGGLYLKSEFTADMGGKEFTGHALIGYHKKAKKYTGTWVDSMTASPTAISGNYSKDGKTLTLNSKVEGPTGEEISQKQVTTFIKDGEKKMEIFVVMNLGGQNQEIKVMSMTCKRRAKK